MIRYALIAAPLMLGCSALAQPPVPSLSPNKSDQIEAPGDIAEAVDDIFDALDGSVDAPSNAPDALDGDGSAVSLEGVFAQGGMVTGKTVPGASVRLDDLLVDVDDFGNFVLGFDRDHSARARIRVTLPDGTIEDQNLEVESVAWKESSITVDNRKANPYAPEDLDQIAKDQATKKQARASRSDDAMWVDGFAWPAEGCISSRFGYRRIVNGTPRRYHSGVDVAAPDGMSPLDYIGATVVAPADGIVRLAESGMFFEGGMVFIDHGQKLESALMHMSSVDVAVGEKVKQGDVVGKVGRTGRVTGPHLHWSLKWQDRLLDPETVVSERAACTD